MRAPRMEFADSLARRTTRFLRVAAGPRGGRCSRVRATLGRAVPMRYSEPARSPVRPAWKGRGALVGSRPGRAEAAAAIWDWRAPKTRPGAVNPGPARLRGVVRALGVAAGGAAIALLWSPGLGFWVLAIATIVLAAAIISPTGLYAAVERALAALTRATGVGLTWVFMSAVFFFAIAPFGLLFRRGRRDAMRRYFEPNATTYWTEREMGRSATTARARQY